MDIPVTVENDKFLMAPKDARQTHVKIATYDRASLTRTPRHYHVSTLDGNGRNQGYQLIQESQSSSCQKAKRHLFTKPLKRS